MSDSSAFRSDFTHLHLHSVYSLLDGAIRIKELVKYIKENGMTSVAVTDHGNMFGAIEFYEAARKEGIKPIIGSEFYMSPGSRFEKKAADNIADGNAYHLVLLAKNQKGYQNLIKLSSLGYLEGFYRKPRIDFELLEKYSEGLIATSACLAGEINRKLLNNKFKEALDLAVYMDNLFGRGNFYLEIQNHGIREQAIAAKGAIEIGRQTGIPLVLTNDSHFLKKEDRRVQDIMMRIQLNKRLEDPLEFGFNEEFYVKTPREMALLFPEVPEAYNNTSVIADMVELELKFGTPLLPEFETPEKMPLFDYMRTLVYKGLDHLFPEGLSDKYKERAEYEMGVVNKMGFEGYFLIVADFIQYARDNGIPVGPGRGSAAGSLVSYALGITSIDPMKYNLLFERFLNPSRNEMPDIDIDFCRDRREEVINYVIEKYGEDHVSQIITFGTLSAKAVIKDVARVIGYDYAEINNISKNLSSTPGITLDEAVSASAEAKAFFSKGDRERMIYEVARALEGVPRNAGKHAAGVVIAPKPISDIIPVAKDTSSGSVISQFEKNNLEKVGLVKMDFLGLKNLTIIQRAVDEIKARKNITIDIDKIPLDHKEPYELLQQGKTKGIFQVENTGITRLLMRSKPKCFEDIVACIALYRPGPLESGMTEAYIQRKSGEKEVVYPHPSLKEILSDTFGTMVYQEQVMLISQIIAGFTMAEADGLRKAMGKKLKDVMDKLKQKFVDQAMERGHKEKWASELFNMMAEFGKYGFNKSHSAAYGLITYQTAWLKAFYTVEFMKATLDADIENTEKLIGIIFDCRQIGIKVLPPDINKSEDYFKVIDEHTILFGLLGIKGVGKNAIDSILQVRNNGPFKDIIDFASRIDFNFVNRKLVEAFVCAGAFDSLNYKRSALFDAIDKILSYGSSMHKDRMNGQSNLFGAEVTDTSSIIMLADMEEWSDEIKMNHEKNTLGLFLSSHPLDKYEDLLNYTSITPISEVDDGVSSEREVTLLGVIEDIKNVTTRRGKTFYSILLSDLSGRKEVRVFENLWKRSNDLLIENGIVIIKARVTIYRDDETPMVMISASNVESGATLSDQVKKSLHLFIPFKDSEMLKKSIQNLKKVLSVYRGENPVFLYYKDTVQEKIHTIKTHSSFNVQYNTELTNDLKAILESEKNIAWQVAGKVIVDSREFALS